MTLGNTRDRFGLVSILNHWLTAVLITGAIGVGWIFEDLERGALQAGLTQIHFSLGLMILALALFRIGWRFAAGLPGPAGAPTVWEHSAARIGHIALMAMIVLMPISGILMQIGEGRELAIFGLIIVPATGLQIDFMHDLAHSLHEGGANMLIFLIAVHVLAALKHHLIDQDPTLLRMLGRSERQVVATAAE